MKKDPSTAALPADATLARGLARLLEVERVSVLDRQLCTYASTFPCEVVTCLCDGDRETRLHCKYTLWNGRELEWHRGVTFEAEVYRQVVNRCGLPAPFCFGILRDEETESSCLVLAHLNGSVRVSKAGSGAMMEAARWIGEFHARHESRAGAEGASLPELDREHLVQWAGRVVAHTAALHDEFPLLRRADEVLDDVASDLAARPRTVIHGEFYPRNVLAIGESVFPIDWETATWGAGEIDLAALTERWAADVAVPCVRAYAESRWPAGPPPSFERALCAARMLWHLRWLGSKPQKRRRKSGTWRAVELTRLADHARALSGR